MVSAAQTWTIHRFLSNNVIMRQLTSPIRDYFCGDSVIIKISKKNGSNIIPTTPASALSSLVLLVQWVVWCWPASGVEWRQHWHWTGNNTIKYSQLKIITAVDRVKAFFSFSHYFECKILDQSPLHNHPGFKLGIITNNTAWQFTMIHKVLSVTTNKKFKG